MTYDKLISRTLELEYGKFVELSIKRGTKADFLVISSGELYLSIAENGQRIPKKRYKGYATCPLYAASKLADTLTELLTAYEKQRDGNLLVKTDEQAKIDPADLFEKGDETHIEARS